MKTLEQRLKHVDEAEKRFNNAIEEIYEAAKALEDAGLGGDGTRLHAMRTLIRKKRDSIAAHAMTLRNNGQLAFVEEQTAAAPEVVEPPEVHAEECTYLGGYCNCNLQKGNM